jgi:hypothetical protein
MKPKDNSDIFDVTIPDATLAGMVTRRIKAAKAHWNNPKYNLDKVREENKNLYLTEYAKDQEAATGKESSADNRMFTSIRAIVPFVTARLSQPEVTPANGKDLAVQFADDFERTMVKVAEKAKAKAVVKLAVQDLMEGSRVGIIEFGFDDKRKKITIKRVDPASVVIDHRAALYDEPGFIDKTSKMTVGEMIRLFPTKKNLIFKWFSIERGVPSQLEQEYDINRTHMFVDDEDGNCDLVVVYSYQGKTLGAMTDPLWDESGTNIIDEPMVPFVFVNFLNSGDGYIDETSFIEQAKYSQRNYDKTSQAIAEEAEWGGTGIPVVSSKAMPAEDLAQVKFRKDKRISLDTDDVGKAFDTWNAGQLPNFILEHKYDARNNVDNTFGTPNIFRGEQSKNNTLGQDVIIRDQAEGRQQELMDAIDASMERFWMLLAQFIYRYFDEKTFMKFIENGKFESLMISHDTIAQNAGLEIGVKGGTSLPPDRSQKRAVALKLLEMNKYPTLQAYKDLGVEKPEEVYKQFILEVADPKTSLDEVDKRVFDREAAEDLQIVIAGEVPEEREDIGTEYIQYVNNWLLTDKYNQLKPNQQQSVTAFAQMVTAKARLKLAKLMSQQPMPPDAAPADPNADPFPAGAGNGRSAGAPTPPPVEEPGLQMPGMADASAQLTGVGV